MFIIGYKKAQQCCIQKLNPNFLFDFASNYGHKQTSICDKNGTNCYNERFVKRFHYKILNNIIFVKAKLCLE